MSDEIWDILGELAEMAALSALSELQTLLDRAESNGSLERWVWGPTRGIIVITSRILDGWEYVCTPEGLTDWLGSSANREGHTLEHFERIARTKLYLTKLTGLPSSKALEEDPAAVLFLAAMGEDAVLYGGSWCEGSTEVATSGLTAVADETCSRLVARAFQGLCGRVVERLQSADYDFVGDSLAADAKTPLARVVNDVMREAEWQLSASRSRPR